MSELIDRLTSACDASNEKEIVATLKVILQKQERLDLKNSSIFQRLLVHKNKEIIKLCLECIAEAAKDEANRTALTKDELISAIVSLVRHEDADVALNAVRSLGNVCYKNEKACELVAAGAGPGVFVNLLEDDDKRPDNQLTTKLLGLLLNLYSLNDNFIKTSLQNERCWHVLNKLLVKYSRAYRDDEKENHALMSYLLSILSTISDFFDEQNVVFEEEACRKVIDVFKASNIPEISVLCLEIFHGQSERDEIKFLLAKEGVCELLFELIEKHRHKVNDEESRSVLKMTCDLIVVILTGDDCMYMLFNNGEGVLYKNMTTWLDTDDDDLISTGVLAIGNFARNDDHCIHMVKNGISKKLIEILKRYNTSLDVNHVKMQHALLSTLKNLAIPKQNKSQILQEGLIDVIYPMIKIDQNFVVFKLLGTFRMIIDGQESVAVDLLGRRDLLDRLVHWCCHSDHLGVRGEAPRLLSWLVRQGRSSAAFGELLDADGVVGCLVEMLPSSHALMQNEALVALDLLCVASTDQRRLSDRLIGADLGKNLSFVLSRYGNKMDRGTVANVLALLEHATPSNVIVEHLKGSNLSQALQKLRENEHVADVAELRERLERVTSVLGD